MGGHFNINHLIYLGHGALWTIGLSLVALIGGSIVGFAIALARISPLKSVRLQRHLCPIDPGHAAPDHPVSRLFRARGDRLPDLAAGCGRLLADHLCRCLSRRDLARRDEIRAEAAMGGSGRAGAQPQPAHAEGDPAAGDPHRDAADRRLHGADHQEHLARVGRGLCRADSARGRSSTTRCSNPS